MLIQRTKKEIIIRLPADVNTAGLQRLVDYLIYREATRKSKDTQAQVNEEGIPSADFGKLSPEGSGQVKK